MLPVQFARKCVVYLAVKVRAAPLFVLPVPMVMQGFLMLGTLFDTNATQPHVVLSDIRTLHTEIKRLSPTCVERMYQYGSML